VVLEEELGFVVGVLMELGKTRTWGRTREEGNVMITNHNSDLGFTA